MRYAVTIIIAGILLLGCEQAPYSLDDTPYKESQGTVEFSLDISDFEFDYYSQEFFIAVEATSPSQDLMLSAAISLSGDTLVAFTLQDDGLGNDIMVQDGIFNANWHLPDSLLTALDSIWTLEVLATSAGSTLSASTDLEPQIPNPPVIEGVSHSDTLYLPSGSNILIDTLFLSVSHPDGLDEIRDASLLSVKPDGSTANNGNPIILYDDGGSTIFFSFAGIDFTSGDKVAGDGIYSLLLPLTSSDQTGTYQWTFKARTWEGLEAEDFSDTLVVLNQSGALAKSPDLFSGRGLLQ